MKKGAVFLDHGMQNAMPGLVAVAFVGATSLVANMELYGKGAAQGL